VTSALGGTILLLVVGTAFWLHGAWGRSRWTVVLDVVLGGAALAEAAVGAVETTTPVLLWSIGGGALVAAATVLCLTHPLIAIALTGRRGVRRGRRRSPASRG
jgi:hypothetical protein